MEKAHRVEVEDHVMEPVVELAGEPVVELVVELAVLLVEVLGVNLVVRKAGVNMNFGEAFEHVKRGGGMFLPQWKDDVVIKAQFPDERSKMTAPYLYVESRFGKVPWKETMIELFSEEWQVKEG